MARIVDHAGYLYSRYQVGADGRTAYERWKGKRTKRPICEFAEKVLYLPLKGARGGKLDAKFHYGIFFGVIGVTGEVIIGTHNGTVKARTIKRRPGAARWDKDMLTGMRRTPWSPDGESSEMMGIRIDIPTGGVDVPPVHRDLQTRRVYLIRRTSAVRTASRIGAPAARQSTEDCQRASILNDKRRARIESRRSSKARPRVRTG